MVDLRDEGLFAWCFLVCLSARLINCLYLGVFVCRICLFVCLFVCLVSSFVCLLAHVVLCVCVCVCFSVWLLYKLKACSSDASLFVRVVS